MKKKQIRQIDKLIQNDDDRINISRDTVTDIIKNLKNGKAIGFSGVSNEMLKMGNTIQVNDTITYLMNWMINEAVIPKLFNISLLKPLVKDVKKSTDSLTNLRPLSVSDVYSNIFEKIILIEIKKDRTDHIKQFGFRGNSLCSPFDIYSERSGSLRQNEKHDHICHLNRRFQSI